MSAVEFLRRVRGAARAKGLEVVHLRHGAAHEVYACGSVRFQMPRNGRLTVGVAERKFRDLAPVLGSSWWRYQ